jgi:hypothetical protein
MYLACGEYICHITEKTEAFYFPADYEVAEAKHKAEKYPTCLPDKRHRGDTTVGICQPTDSWFE